MTLKLRLKAGMFFVLFEFGLGIVECASSGGAVGENVLGVAGYLVEFDGQGVEVGA